MNPDALLIDDPQTTGDRFLVQMGDHAQEHVPHGGTALGPQAQNDQAGGVLRRKHLDVGEIQVQRDQDPSLGATGVRDLVILPATKALSNIVATS